MQHVSILAFRQEASCGLRACGLHWQLQWPAPLARDTSLRVSDAAILVAASGARRACMAKMCLTWARATASRTA